MQRSWVNTFATVFAIVLSGVSTARSQSQAAETVHPKVDPGHCQIRTAPLSPGDQAMAHRQYVKAVDAYRAESKVAGPEGDRAHTAEIRAMLREGHIKDADREARPWGTGATANVWAKLALAEVEWREGHVVEAGQILVAAGQLDPCNAQLHADFAAVMLFSGKAATASSQLTVAHKLDPMNQEIASDWIELQPRSVQLAEVNRILSDPGSISPAEKASLEKRKIALSTPVTDSCRLATAVPSTSIPFRGIQDGPNAPTFWGLEVALNGKVRRLEIDTGAHGMVLTRGAAAALHLVPEERFQMRGLGDEGNVDSFVAKVASIKIGNLEFQNCDVEVQTKDMEVSGSEDGLIGGDVFESFLLTLDFPGRLLKLDPLPPLPGEGAQRSEALATGVQVSDAPQRDRYIDPSMKDWTKVFRSGHDLILPIRLNEGPVRLFIVDTGSQSNLISPDAAREVGHVSNGSDDDIYGISGKVKKTYTTGALNLDFAGMRYPTPGMTAIDTSGLGRDTGVEISGFLGAPTLHQLTLQIDYRDDLLHFSFDPKRLTRCVDGIKLADCF